MHLLEWANCGGIPSRAYECGWCARSVASQYGWVATPRVTGGRPSAFVYVCHHCTRPTFFDLDGKQLPGSAVGSPVADIPDEPARLLYEEARHAASSGSYTAAVLCCRKLLMHIAVAKGAKPGLHFVEYVQYLAEQHFVPPDALEWVDHIRKKGNEATHEIALMKAHDAADLLDFCSMLLKVIFEFPAVIKRRAAKG